MSAVAINPLEVLQAQGLSDFLRAICSFGLSDRELQQLNDEIDALALALTELRDSGHLDLNFRAVSNFATLDGFLRLAQDERLSIQARDKCGEVHSRLVSSGATAMLLWGGN